MADHLATLKNANVDSPRTAKLATDPVLDRWRRGDVAVKQGGASPQFYLDSLRRAGLAVPELSDVKKGIKNGTLRIYQLGDEESGIWFSLRKDGNETRLEGITNTEQGAAGIGTPAVLLKALQEGATAVDCVVEKSKQFPDGYLPHLYREFGFEIDGEEVPGKDGQPGTVTMRWNGSDADRNNILGRYLASGTEGVFAGRDLAVATADADVIGRDAEKASGAGRADTGGTPGDQATGDARPLAPVRGNPIRSTAELSDLEAQNLGISPDDLAAMRERINAADVSTFMRRDIDALVEGATQMSSWKDWYDRHQEIIKRVFGDDAAMFSDFLSATSQAASVPANVGLALKAYRQFLAGEKFTGYLPAVIKNLESAAAREKLRGQKISEYGSANEGNEAGVAVDRHIAQLMYGVDIPKAWQVKMAQRVIGQVAKRLGWQPREVQAALWAYNQVLRGIDPSEVKSYDTYIAKQVEQINEVRAKFNRGNAEGVQSGEPVRAGTERSGQRSKPARAENGFGSCAVAQKKSGSGFRRAIFHPIKYQYSYWT